MAVTETRMDTDLLIIGGGPAGCAAALMAASLGTRSTLIEPDALCRKLRHIPALDNVPGGFTTGPDLAAAITADVDKTALCHIELGARVTEVRAFDDHVEVTVDSRRRLTAPHAVIATGVGPLQPEDAAWITIPPDAVLPPLWEADAAQAAGRTLLVIGADRPLGTFLRAHPEADIRFRVPYPPSDGYKIDEVRADRRVTLTPVEHLTLTSPTGSPITAETTAPGGARQSWTADAAFLNLGSIPTAPPGDLTHDTTGYYPPTRQHPRLLIAGDLRSTRFQRITTAMGSGSEAALRAYYTAQELPG